MVARLAGEHEVTAWTRQDVDLTRHQDVREAVGELAPQAIINCAATTTSMRAEDDQCTALDVNAMVVGTLARPPPRVERRVHALQHRLRVRRHRVDAVYRDRAARAAQRVRPVEIDRRVAGRRRAAALRAARRKPVRRTATQAAASIASSMLVRAGQPAPVFVDRVVSPSFVADVADASAFILRGAAAGRPLSLRQFRSRDVARGRRRRSSGISAGRTRR